MISSSRDIEIIGRDHSMDVVEVNPILDIRSWSARLASDRVASGLGQRIL